MENLQAFHRVADTHFFVLDQLKLPTVIEQIRIDTIQDAWRVIKDMNVRGAPLISVVATQAIRNELATKSFSTLQELQYYILNSVEYLRTSRPTAVNLFNDTESLNKAVGNFKEDNQSSIQGFKESLVILIDSFNQQYIDACHKMSILGVDAIIKDFEDQHPEKKNTNKKLKVLTICNTGKLATPGDGTALGIVRELHRRGRLERLYIAETRPYNQGARLTASEAVLDKLPGTLITDSMAGFLMQQGNVDFVVVGADRVVKNGDAANKIGTYTFAVLAKHHHVNFYVALPTQTIDKDTLRGGDIHIEQRPREELTHIKGIQIAPSEIDVWNPSFDITPSALIKRIFHEGGEYDCDRSLGSWVEMNENLLKENLVKKYQIFSQDDVLSVSEVGDGNLNLVFIVSSANKQVIVKQALPYVRCVGPSWPFPLSRAYFEYQALQFEESIVPEFIPQPLVFDNENALIVMEYLPPPFIILRKGLIQQIKYENLAKDIAVFMAKTHFFSSALHLSCKDFRLNIEKWSQNTEMCALSEQVIFSDPYVESKYNKWTSPQLDEIANSFKTTDEELILSIADLRHTFISSKEALLHGDLHTGSIMVTADQTRVIDPEFAFSGPLGFDIGSFLANLLLNYFSQKQYAASQGAQLNSSSEYAEWVLQTTLEFYQNYEKEFISLWNDPQNTINGGDYMQTIISKSNTLRQSIQKKYLKNVLHDSLGFTGAKMIRRIVGIAHVEDLESITDQEIKANCELTALKFARDLTVNRESFTSIQGAIELARKYFQSQKQ